MSIKLRVLLIIFSLVFFAVVARLVRHGRLQLKYSLLWLAIGLAFLLSAIFPGSVTFLKGLLGIELASNFVFFAALAGLFAVSLSLTVIVSWQSRDIRMLIQQIALLQKKLEQEQGEEQEQGARRTPPPSHNDTNPTSNN
ncbi:MAG: DUF2304 domain-containing protein [Atopobiaceae bacterium]|nr:DUF2304 domain-containing protein [Atopobiaceae bacterium]